MKNQCCSLIFLVGGLLYFVLLSNSAGAPAQVTGAPSEATCGRSGCHAVVENTGDAAVSLNYGTGPLTYNPQEVYPINIALTNLLNEAKNGFQIVALDTMNKNAGSWELVDEATTQVLSGSSLADRSYVTHTAAGNLLNSWNMNWIAPAEDIGPITFYLAVNDANGDGGRVGDDIYFTNVSINASNTTSTTANLKRQVAIFPNPTRNFLSIYSPNLPILQANIYTATGHLILQQAFPTKLDVSSYSTGLYLLELQTTNGVLLEKILVH